MKAGIILNYNRNYISCQDIDNSSQTHDDNYGHANSLSCDNADSPKLHFCQCTKLHLMLARNRIPILDTAGGRLRRRALKAYSRVRAMKRIGEKGSSKRERERRESERAGCNKWFPVTINKRRYVHGRLRSPVNLESGHNRRGNLESAVDQGGSYRASGSYRVSPMRPAVALLSTVR